MDINTIIKEKKEKNLIIKKRHWLLLKHKSLWLIKLTNKTLIKDLRDWLLVLPSCFVVFVEWLEFEKLWDNIVATWELKESDFIGFDFIVCDENIENINSYFENWITPLMPQKSHINSLLKEFNPMKNEWNSFLFESTDKWTIFYALVRYLENYKFPFDNKNLVKNVINI